MDSVIEEVPQTIKLGSSQETQGWLTEDLSAEVNF